MIQSSGHFSSKRISREEKWNETYFTERVRELFSFFKCEKFSVEKIRYDDWLILLRTFSNPSKIYIRYDKRFHIRRKGRKSEEKWQREREKMRDRSDSIFIFSRETYTERTYEDVCRPHLWEDVLAYAENCIRRMNREGLAADIKVSQAARKLAPLVFFFRFSFSPSFFVDLFGFFVCGNGASAFRSIHIPGVTWKAFAGIGTRKWKSGGGARPTGNPPVVAARSKRRSLGTVQIYLPGLVVILRDTNFARLLTPKRFPRRRVYDVELAGGKLFERL